ncbi:MAG: zinc ABC transporter substrate-binding protein [Phycisphaeraceae bacterium]|nr:zinc ABC transporter substrate-binding protein [Phycisphaeraceae bacterium]
MGHSRWLVVAAVLLSMAGCEPGGGDAASERGSHPFPSKVVATTGMAGDLARRVLGDAASVEVLMGPGVDPHLYKPTRDDMAKILRADLVVSNGLLLEGKMGDLLGRQRSGVALGSLLPPSELLLSSGDDGEPDPHIWMDPLLWALAAERFAEALAADHPEAREALTRRAADYAEELRALHAWSREAISTVPEARRVLITSHDAFGYLGRAYGVRVEGIQGVSTDSEPGLRRILELVDLVVRQQVPVVFVETSVPRRSVEALIEGARARGHQLAVGGELFSDALGPADRWEGSVAGMLDHNMTVIVRGLGGTAPERGWRGRLGAAASTAKSPPVDGAPESGRDHVERP